MSKFKEYYDFVLETEANAIKNLKNIVDYDTLDKIVDLMISISLNKNKVITSGCGTSGTVAKRVAHTLSCIGIPAFFLSPADSPHGALGVIKSGDVVVLFTKGGNTPEILNFLPYCKEKCAIVIGVTENRDSTLAEKCDVLLLLSTGEEPCPWKIMPCSSTMGAVAIWDAIILTKMQIDGFTKEEFLKNHPGGRTAQRLSDMITAEKMI